MEEKKLFFNDRRILLFCIAGFVLCFVAYYPGFLSVDSLEQYFQVVTNKYDDWHPPIMAGLWHLLNMIHKGPVLMLVFQLLCLWVSVYILLKLIENDKWKVAIALVAFMPFVQNFCGYIIKDSEMTLTWLLAVALILKYDLRNKKIPFAVSIFIFLLLIYGSWVRTNAFAGAIPLIIWFVYVVFKKRNTAIKILAAILMTGLVIAGHSIQDVVFDTDATYPEYKLYMEDITGIYVKTGVNYYPPSYYNHKGFDTVLMKAHYTPATFDDEWENDPMISVPEGTDSTAPPAKIAWIKALKEHPFVYLRNRFDGYLYYLRIKNRNPGFIIMYPWILKNHYGFEFHKNIISEISFRYVLGQKVMPYMRPWFWFFLNFILLFFISSIRTKPLRHAFAALIFSCIFYQALMFFVFPVDTEFRYFYWNCIAESLAVCLWIGDRAMRNER